MNVGHDDAEGPAGQCKYRGTCIMYFTSHPRISGIAAELLTHEVVARAETQSQHQILEDIEPHIFLGHAVGTACTLTTGKVVRPASTHLRWR